MIPNLHLHLKIVQATETKNNAREAIAKTLVQGRNPVMDYMVAHPDTVYMEPPTGGGFVVGLIVVSS